MTKSVDRAADASLRAKRALSRLVFGGAQYRIEVGAAIAEPGKPHYFNLGGLAEQTGISKQSIGHELKLLEEAGLIVRVPPVDGGRKVYYGAQPSAYWSWCLEASHNALDLLQRNRPY